MKTTGLLTVLSLALLAGCASTAARTAKAPAKVRDVEDTVVIPYNEAPPGSMEMDWEPKELPPPPEVKPRRAEARPEWVTKKRSLFVLPTK